MPRYPFLISIPHGGLVVPEEIQREIALNAQEIIYYSDPDTRLLYDYHGCVEAVIDTQISRMVIDLNRPPYTLPPRHTDGAVKLLTPDSKPVYFTQMAPDITLIHQMMMRYYFPYHAQIDQLLQQDSIGIAFDCHSMLPVGPAGSRDAGRRRPLICLGNNGDRKGRPKKGRLSTCSAEWMTVLADAFRSECQLGDEVMINDPFSGGFITNAHYWHTGIPFVQIEVNRLLYEPQDYPYSHHRADTHSLRKSIWKALVSFWDGVGEKATP